MKCTGFVSKFSVLTATVLQDCALAVLDGPWNLALKLLGNLRNPARHPAFLRAQP